MQERRDLTLAVILLDWVRLDRARRGHRLLGSIITALLDLLQLDAAATVLVTHPEPQQPEGGPYPAGPVRDAAMARLAAATRSAGLEPWRGGPVWVLTSP